MGRPRTIAVLAFDGAQMLDVTGPAEVFAAAGGMIELGGAANPYDIRIVSPDGADVTTCSGLRIGVSGSVAELVDELDGPIDTLIIPGTPDWARASADPMLLAAVAELAPRTRRLTSVCVGAFVLGAVGLLDGRRVTTHWMFADELAARVPSATVDPDPIFVVDGPVHTSAGVTAGIDLALAMVEADYGADLARQVARYLVVFMQRPGGQSQFSVRLRHSPPSGSALRPLLDEIAANPAGDYRLTTLSERAGYAERHLTRMFMKEVGTTPARFVEQTRVEAARVLMETSDAPFETVARLSGLGSPDTLRRVFTREVGIAPAEYRQRFRTTGVPARSGSDGAERATAPAGFAFPGPGPRGRSKAAAGA